MSEFSPEAGALARVFSEPDQGETDLAPMWRKFFVERAQRAIDAGWVKSDPTTEALVDAACEYVDADRNGGSTHRRDAFAALCRKVDAYREAHTPPDPHEDIARALATLMWGPPSESFGASGTPGARLLDDVRRIPEPLARQVAAALEVDRG